MTRRNSIRPKLNRINAQFCKHRISPAWNVQWCAVAGILRPVALLDALEIERATLVGHSLGSFVARRVAIANPERVESLLLIGTGVAASNPVTRDLQNVLRDLPDPIPLQFAREFQGSTAYRPLPPECFDRIVAESLKLPPRLWRLAIDHMVEYDDTQRLHRHSVTGVSHSLRPDAFYAVRISHAAAAAATAMMIASTTSTMRPLVSFTRQETNERGRTSLSA